MNGRREAGKGEKQEGEGVWKRYTKGEKEEHTEEGVVENGRENMWRKSDMDREGKG